MDSSNFDRLIGTGVADASGEVLFRQEKKSSIIGDRCSLIIGVGGSGCTTVNEIKRMMNRKVRDSDQRVAFLIIDTDETSLEACVQLKQEEKLCLKPTTAGANRRWHNKDARIASVKKWIRSDFRQDLEGDGAGRYRQAARAMLYDFGTTAYTNNEKAKDIIRERFDALTIGANNKVQVYITLGLAGGTGSGLLIDIADLVHRAAPVSVDITGFFYLPDATWEITRGNTNQASLIQSNGYAALKELDYYYSVNQRDSAYFEQSDAEEPLETAQYKAGVPLYKMVFLVSGTGNQTAKNARESVIESLVNLITEKSSDDQDANHHFMSTSWLANKNSAREQRLANLDPSVEGIFPEDVYDYCSIGLGIATIPDDIIKSYAIGYLASKLYGGTSDEAWRERENPLSVQEAKRLLDRFILNQDDLLSPSSGKIRELCSRLEWPANTMFPSPEEIVNEKRNSELSRLLKINDNKDLALDELRIYLRGKYDSFISSASEIMMQYGPKCLMHLWNGYQPGGATVISSGISGKLKEISKNYERNYGTLASEQKLNEAIANSRGTNVSLNSKGFIGKTLGKLLSNSDNVKINLNNKMHGWSEAFRKHKIEIMITEVSQTVFESRAGMLMECYINPINTFIEQVERFDLILDKMKIVYENLGADFKRYDETEAGTPLQYNILGDDEAYEWAYNIVQRTVTQQFYQNDLRKKLVESFIESPQQWMSEEKDPNTGYIPARKLYDEVMRNVIESGDSQLNDFSIKTYMQYKKSRNNDTDYNNVAEQLIRRIVTQARALYPKANTALQEGIEHVYVLIPDNFKSEEGGVEFYEALKNAAENLQQNIKVYPSPITGRIVCYRLVCALPINILKDIEVWEAAYDSQLRREKHSNESDLGRFSPIDGLRWEDYPALAYRRHKMSVHVNCRENVFMRDIFETIFAKAEDEKYGILRLVRNEEDNTYKYTFFNIASIGLSDNYLVDIENGKYNKRDEYGRYRAGEHLIEFLAKEKGKSLDGITEDVKLIFHEVLTDNKTNASEARMAAKRALRRHVPMFLCVKKSLRLLERNIEEINKANEGVSNKRLQELFSRLLAYNYLHCAGDDWRLYDTHDEANRGVSERVLRMVSAQFKTMRDKTLYAEKLHYLLIYDSVEKCNTFRNGNNIEKYWNLADEIHNAIFLDDKLSANLYAQSLEQAYSEATEFIKKYADTAVNYQSNRDALNTKAAIDNSEKKKFWDNSLSIYGYIIELYQELSDK